VILRPGPKYLTEFYLFISLGGAVGGILVGLLAPQMFSSYLEMPLALMLLITLMSIILMTDEDYELYAFASRGTLAAVLIAYLVISTKLVGQIKADDQDSIHQTRNFYGVLRVIESESNNPEKHRYMLQHGNIIHGLQFRKVERRREPTAYYGPGSGIALTLNLLKPPGQRRIAVLGLGVGTVAAFGAAGDYIRFYEINPDVIDYARRHFTYISDTPAQTDLILGDARLSLESENPNNFDIMLIDTFSGDAIPVHLITKEAIQLYLRHLNQDGVLVINISTQHFDMAPLISTIAESFGLQHRIIRSTADLPNHIYPTIFALLSRNSAFLERPEITAAAAARPATGPASGRKVQLWTDDYSNVFELLRRNIL
jgi:hypothetical protein